MSNLEGEIKVHDNNRRKISSETEEFLKKGGIIFTIKQGETAETAYGIRP